MAKKLTPQEQAALRAVHEIMEAAGELGCSPLVLATLVRNIVEADELETIHGLDAARVKAEALRQFAEGERLAKAGA